MMPNEAFIVTVQTQVEYANDVNHQVTARRVPDR